MLIYKTNSGIYRGTTPKPYISEINVRAYIKKYKPNRSLHGITENSCHTCILCYQSSHKKHDMMVVFNLPLKFTYWQI